MKTLVEKWDGVARGRFTERVRAAARLVEAIVLEAAQMRRDAAKRYPGSFDV